MNTPTSRLDLWRRISQAPREGQLLPNGSHRRRCPHLAFPQKEPPQPNSSLPKAETCTCWCVTFSMIDYPHITTLCICIPIIIVIIITLTTYSPPPKNKNLGTYAHIYMYSTTPRSPSSIASSPAARSHPQGGKNTRHLTPSVRTPCCAARATTRSKCGPTSPVQC